MVTVWQLIYYEYHSLYLELLLRACFVVGPIMWYLCFLSSLFFFLVKLSVLCAMQFVICDLLLGGFVDIM